jgi:8-oxo-dGTP diphosphatase
VHRRQYDDWSLPKGKLEPGESWEQGALREVQEETSLRCTILAEVGRSYYLDGAGRDKEVRYFRMEADGEAVAQNEIDQVAWVALDEAPRVLSYPRDAALLSGLA